MNIRLQVFKEDSMHSNYLHRSFRFAVVDFSKSQSYPSNFICMLPVQLGAGNPRLACSTPSRDGDDDQGKPCRANDSR